MPSISVGMIARNKQMTRIFVPTFMSEKNVNMPLPFHSSLYDDLID
jgi:hypothetical protein